VSSVPASGCSRPRRWLARSSPAAACAALHGLTGSTQELLGGGKEKESLRSLLRARRFLNLKFGNIVVVFGQPIDVQAWPVPTALQQRRG
jgi:hypothetical protein